MATPVQLPTFSTAYRSDGLTVQDVVDRYPLIVHSQFVTARPYDLRRTADMRRQPALFTPPNLRQLQHLAL